jgi:thiamine monophosphate synthase
MPAVPFPDLVCIVDAVLCTARGLDMARLAGQLLDAGAPLVALHDRAAVDSASCDWIEAGDESAAAGRHKQLLAIHESAVLQSDGSAWAGCWLPERAAHLVADPLARAALRSWRWVGVSVHAYSSELPAAADFFVLGPWAETSSKPGYGPALGVEGVMNMRRRLDALPDVLQGRRARIRLVIVGGVLPDQVLAIRQAGADAVAVMGPLHVEQPAAVLHDYLQALAHVRAQLSDP